MARCEASEREGRWKERTRLIRLHPPKHQQPLPNITPKMEERTVSPPILLSLSPISLPPA